MLQDRVQRQEVGDEQSPGKHVYAMLLVAPAFSKRSSDDHMSLVPNIGLTLSQRGLCMTFIQSAHRQL